MNVIVTRKNRRSWWYLRIVADDGETVTTTRCCFTKSIAVRAASNIVRSARTEPWTFVVDHDA